jgi:NADH-quinone oxidoreductase subunit N
MITPISIDMASLNIASLTPMLVSIFGALLILCLDLVLKNNDKFLYVALTVVVLLVDLGTVVGYSNASRGFFDVMLMDGISILGQAIIIITSAFFILLTLTKQRFHEFTYPEYFALFLFMTAGFQFMVASDNLILIFVGLETASMALYTMIAMHNRDKSTEAAIKYFTMGALAAGFFAFSSMIFYYLTGSIELNVMAEHFAKTNFENHILILVAVVFMIGAIGIKLTLVPFHLWAPDVYEGSSATLAGYIAVVPKMAVLVFAIRFFEIFVQANDIWVHYILYGIAVVTMTLPNLIALVQTDIKRMLAFSSISHAGFVLVAIMLGTTQAIESLFLYWILFLAVILGAFAMLWIHKTKEKPEYYGLNSDYDLGKFTGLVHTAPFTAFMFGIIMFALAGLPPFSVFWGKMYLVGATINSGEIVLAIVMVLNSAIAAFYYLKVIVHIFLLKREDGKILEYQAMGNTIVTMVIASAIIFTMFSIFLVEPLLNIISVAVQNGGF